MFICTVNWNNIEGLEKTLKSYNILDKKKFKIHPIVIDNLSNDGSIKLVSDSCIPIISEIDNGTYDAMNKGITYFNSSHFKDLRNKFLVFMNSGDEFYEEINSIQLSELLNQDIIIGKNLRDDGSQDERYDLKLLKYGLMPVCHQAILYNLDRLAPEEIYFSTKTISFNDYHQMYRLIIRKNKCYKYLDNNIAVYEQNTTSGLSRSHNRFRKEKFRIILELSGIKGIFLAIFFKIFSVRIKRKASI